MPRDSAAEAVDRYLRRAVPFGFSGAVLIATGDEVRLARGYGWADREARRPNTAHTVFSLGSITKSLTATAMLRLVDQGELALSNTLPHLLEAVPDDKSTVTLEHLLSHTAGLLDATGDDFDHGERSDVLDAILTAPLIHPPGSAYAYSNAGFTVLAAIIESVTSSSYESALRALVLDPAGMTRTGYLLPAWNRAELAHFYVGDVDFGVHVDKTFPSWHIMGNGEMLSTVHDLYRLTRALAGGTLLSDAAVQEAFRPRLDHYGLGWSSEVTARGRVVGHDGASPNGVSASLRWFQDSDSVVVLLCNRDYAGGFLIHTIEPRLIDLTFGHDLDAPPPLPRTTAPAADPTGTFVTGGGDRATIRSSADGWMVEFSGQGLLDLVGGDPPAQERVLRNQRTFELVRTLLAGDDAGLADLLGGDDRRLERYRQFITDRLGTDPSQVQLDGSLPAQVSVGRLEGVQLGRRGATSEGAVRVYWDGEKLAGLGHGTRPLLELPLVPVAEHEYLLHHLGLGTTVTLTLVPGATPSELVVQDAAGRVLTATALP